MKEVKQRITQMTIIYKSATRTTSSCEARSFATSCRGYAVLIRKPKSTADSVWTRLATERKAAFSIQLQGPLGKVSFCFPRGYITFCPCCTTGTVANMGRTSTSLGSPSVGVFQVCCLVQRRQQPETAKMRARRIAMLPHLCWLVSW